MPGWRMNCAPMIENAIETTEDAFLGGQLQVRQPKSGHRAGHDAMLLAASVAAREGDRVVEFGAGVGVAGLAVAKRCAGIRIVLVEIDPALAQLARGNAAANGIKAKVVAMDVVSTGRDFAAAGIVPDSVDVVLMNPPFNDPKRHRSSPSKQLAHVALPTTLERWIAAARRILKSGGVLTLIWRADGLAEAMTALERGFGGLVIQPVHGDATAPAIRVLIRATKGSSAAPRIYAGVMLSDEAGLPNKAVQDILAGKGALRLATA
jgi:tRNA1(Val) A37 N6-methylase TrmN6